MPWDCRPETLEFTVDPPAHFLTEGEIDATPERVFAVLADITSWPRWFDDMRDARWTGPAHSGAGATRHMVLGAVSVDETFLVWEPGQRFSFRLDTISLPLVRAFVEDWRLLALPDGRTKLSWRVAYEPTWLARLIHPVLRAIFIRQFRRTVAGLAAFASR